MQSWILAMIGQGRAAPPGSCRSFGILHPWQTLMGRRSNFCYSLPLLRRPYVCFELIEAASPPQVSDASCTMTSKSGWTSPSHPGIQAPKRFRGENHPRCDCQSRNLPLCIASARYCRGRFMCHHPVRHSRDTGGLLTGRNLERKNDLIQGIVITGSLQNPPTLFETYATLQ